MARREVPSKVTDRDFLYMPPEDEVSDDEEWKDCGKWVLHMPEFGMEMLNETWLSLQQLLHDGTLIMLKASTESMGLEHAHIQCFTRPGKERAKMAADAIRKVLREEEIDFKGIMYYKQNEQTIQGLARRKGHKNLTKYMHTYLGRFYERDELSNWTLDDDDENNIEASITNRYYVATFSGSYELPARSAKRFEILQQAGTEELEDNWYVYCSCRAENVRYLAPADRVWMVAKELYDHGVFDKISWSIKNRKVEIRFYVSQESDIHNQIAICDRIFEEACFRGIMYYHRRGSDKYSYKYTSEKELYEYREFGEIYLPNEQE